MNVKQALLALDIGTSKVCSIIGAITQDDNLEIIGIGNQPCQGVKKGAVVNIDQTITSIRKSLEEAQFMAGLPVTTAIIGISGNHVFSFNSSGVVPIKGGREVTHEDVERAIEAAKAVVIPSEREVIHVIPQEFKVDNATGIKNPIGMCGVRLEVKVHIVTGVNSYINNMIKSVESAGLKVVDVVLQPLASSRAVLGPEEQELGVALVDIGAGTSDLAVWKDGSLIHSQIIPVGGNHFTSDLAVALKIPHSEAERIKIDYGAVLKGMVSKESVRIQGVPGMKTKEVPQSLVCDVLAARAEELFEIVKKILVEKKILNQVTGGFVLTGGGANLAGLVELGEFVLERPIKLGYPMAVGHMSSLLHSPQFATGLGILRSSELESFEAVEIKKEKLKSEKPLFNKLGNSLKGVLKDIF